MKRAFKVFLRRLHCAIKNQHRWERESSLVVCRAERDRNNVITFIPDHHRYYCPLCRTTKKEPFIPVQ